MSDHTLTLLFNANVPEITFRIFLSALPQQKTSSHEMHTVQSQTYSVVLNEGFFWQFYEIKKLLLS